MKPSGLTKVKIAVSLGIFCIILSGQLFHSIIIDKNYKDFVLPIFISYSLLSALIGYFITGFIVAEGNFRRKVRFVKLSAIYFIFLIIVNRYFIPDHIPGSGRNLFVTLIQPIVTGLIVTLIVIFDSFFKSGQNFDFISEKKQLPQKYLRPHPLRTILESVFRLFPLPEPVALYRIGNPDDKSPVIVTGNFELTVRRVAKSLQGLDCWLLICDSRGINVWCSSLSGHFSEKNIIQAARLTDLTKYISHKRLILPQLCAAGVDLRVIKQKAGFTCVFGPVYIEYIKDFLGKSRDEAELRKVRFDLGQRIEMSAGSPIMLSALLTFIYLFIDISKLSFILPVLYFVVLIQAVVYPRRPIKWIPLWAFVYSVFVTGIITGIVLFSGSFSSGWSIGIAVTMGIGIFYLINEFEGWSPQVKYNLKSIYLGVKSPEITVDEEKCIGCGLCFQVCPKAVFRIEEGKAEVLDRKECIDCSACYNQCPVNAIFHSFDKREKEKCSCVYCRIQDNLKE